MFPDQIPIDDLGNDNVYGGADITFQIQSIGIPGDDANAIRITIGGDNVASRLRDRWAYLATDHLAGSSTGSIVGPACLNSGVQSISSRAIFRRP